jgi:hypothetical protein
MRHAGIVITLEQTINIYLSLKTVPVLVLDGPSGIGKNLVARTMAEAMAARFVWLPMTNESGTGPANAPIRLRDLLGLTDPRTGEFHPEPLYGALRSAAQAPDEAHLVCIDTIDGWQEDAWLSEYVRLLDSRSRASDGRVASAPIVAENVPGELALSDNLFLVIATMGRVGLGMVGVERANVVELGPADLSLDALRPGHKPEGTSAAELGKMLVAGRSYRSLGDIVERPWIEAWNDEVTHLSAMLEEIDLGIGYRLRDDMLRYLAYADDLNAQLPYGTSFSLDTAFDWQIAQRIVPRLLLKEPDEETVSELLMYAHGPQDSRPARFPRTAAQLEALQRRMD